MQLKVLGLGLGFKSQSLRHFCSLTITLALITEYVYKFSLDKGLLVHLTHHDLTDHGS